MEGDKVMKLQRWDPPRSFPTKALAWIPCDDGDWCRTDDVDVLEQRCAELLERLEIMASQHYCGCGDGACKRCGDDKMNEEIINKVKGTI